MRKYEIEVDGVRVSNTKDGKDSMVTQCQYTASSKFLGNIVAQPFRVANDGLIEISGFQDAEGKGLTASSIGERMEKNKKGGLSHYDFCIDGWRGRKIKVTQTGIVGATTPDLKPKSFSIDGEPWEFQNYVSYECLPDEVEWLFDYKQYFEDMKLFKQ